MERKIDIRDVYPPGKYFMMGNEAIVVGALLAGCKVYAGYPITPSSEIMNLMARYLPLMDGIFIQMEDEIASIMAIIGASMAGVRSMTATSGPGFSLMQEGIGYAIMTETPIVIVDIMRAGPSTGQATKAAQGDVMQSRWGRHGDQEVIVYSPASAQEMLDFAVDAFNAADTYRVPVIIAADEIVGHAEEIVEVPDKDTIDIIERREPRRPDEIHFGGDGVNIAPFPTVGKGFNVLITGSTHNEKGYRKTQDPETHRRLVWHLVNKIRRNRDKIVRYIREGSNDAEIGIVAYGAVYRAAKEAIEIAEREGIKIELFRPIVLWPSPDKELRKFAEDKDIIIVPELNTGMYILEVERLVKSNAEIIPINKIGGGLPIYPEEIISVIKKALRR